MNDFQPLTDIYNVYSESIEAALKEGFINDPDLAEDYVWPFDLKIGDLERDDIRQYVNDRMVEIVERIHKDRGIDPNILAGTIFRSIISGMMFELERIGK